MLIEDSSVIDALLEIPPKSGGTIPSAEEIIEKFSPKPDGDANGHVAEREKETQETLALVQPQRREFGKGRQRGIPNKTDEQRAEIGSYARAAGVTEASETFGVSTAAAAAYKEGKNTPAGPVRQELVGAIERKLSGARIKAADHLDSLLDLLDGDLFLELRPLERIKAAQGMAAIADKLKPVDKSAERTLILKVPEIQDTQDTYEVIDVTPEGKVLPSV